MWLFMWDWSVGADGLAVGSSSESGCVVVSVPDGTCVCCQKWSIKSMRSNVQEGQGVSDPHFNGFC